MKNIFLAIIINIIFNFSSSALELVCNGAQQRNLSQKPINVNCANRKDVVEALEFAWMTLRKERIGGSTEDMCWKPYQRAMEMPPSIPFAQVAPTFFVQCNMALQHVQPQGAADTARQPEVVKKTLLAPNPYPSDTANTVSDLRVGIDPTYEPFTFKTNDGKPAGFDVDIANALCKYLKRRCVFVEQEWDGMIPGLYAKKYEVIISSMSITDDRLKEVDFTDKYYNAPSRVVLQKGIQYIGPASIRGMRIGVLKGSTQEAYAIGELKSVGVVVRTYEAQDQIYRDMMMGRLDGTVADLMEVSGGFLNKPEGYKYALVGPELRDPKYFGYGAGIALRKGQDGLRRELNAGIKAIRDNGIYKALNDKYFGQFNIDIYGDAKPAPPSSGLAPTSKFARNEPLKIAFAYVGPVGDGGWTYSHDQARLQLEKEFGNRITVTMVENVPESQDAERVFRDMLNEGNTLIFGTTFGYMESMLKIAGEYKNAKFEHATGYKTAPNMRTYDVRSYEGAYLAGVVAGGMTKSNVLGVVASVPIPEVIRNINSFTLGAQLVNPKIKTKVVWVNEWFNPPKEAEAADSLISAGVDILMQNTDSPAVLQTAQKRGKRAFGWDSDMSAYAPKAHLASAVNVWAPYYVKATNDVLNGTWSTGSVWWGMKEGAIDLVTMATDISPSISSKVEEIKSDLRRGTYPIWKGPLLDNKGNLRLALDELANDTFLQGMTFYVQGVEGKVPGTK